jgi:hypothetical protein
VLHLQDDVTNTHGVKTTNRSEGKNNAVKNHNGMAPASTHDNMVVSSQKVMSSSHINHLQTSSTAERSKRRRLLTNGTTLDDSIVRHLTEPAAVEAMRRLESITGRKITRLKPPADGRLLVRSEDGAVHVMKPPTQGTFRADAMWTVSGHNKRDRFAAWNSKKKYKPDGDCKANCPNFYKETFVYGMLTNGNWRLMCCHDSCNQDGQVCAHILAVNCGYSDASDFPPWSLRALHNGDLDANLFSTGIGVVAPARTTAPLRVPVDHHGICPDQASFTAHGDGCTDTETEEGVLSGGDAEESGRNGGGGAATMTVDMFCSRMMAYARGGNLTQADMSQLLLDADSRVEDQQHFRGAVSGAGFNSGHRSRPGFSNHALHRFSDRRTHAAAAKGKKGKGKKKK